MSPTDLRTRLSGCPAGRKGWKQFEDVCIDTLKFLFVPPLREPHIQPRTRSGTERRDAVFPNRILDFNTNWGQLRHELEARMILFEFKNYDLETIGVEETRQTAAYMRRSLGRLAIMCCNALPDNGAHIKRNSVYSEDDKVILFVTTDHLLEMISIKERGGDPSDLIMDMLERFYLQHE